MPRNFLSLGEPAPPAFQGGETFAIAGRAVETLENRCVRYVFSDPSVGRDMHTIAAGAWQTRNYESNPVFLWAHQDDELPIGRVESLDIGDPRLTGVVRYADHAFADTVYQLVKGRYLNATSTGWLPLEWRAAGDRSRPGGLDFTRVELLEISQVPVPALPTAIATARAAGIDVAPLYSWAERLLDAGDFAVLPRAQLETLRKASRMPIGHRAASKWKCGAARNLPIDDKTAWDGAAATKRMLDEATKDGEIDGVEARRGFLLYDAGAPDERGAYKEPFADIVDGKLTAIAGGVRAAAQRLPQVDDVPEAVRAEAEKVIEAYHKKLVDEVKEPERALHALARALKQRDLCSMADFAYMLAYLDGLYDRVAAEAGREDDGSDVPAALRAWLDDGNRLLLEMAGEETQEQIDGTQDDPWSRFRGLKSAVARALADLGVAPTRAGKKHSAETVRCLREIHGHIRAAHRGLTSLLSEADEDADPAGDDGDEAQAERARKAKAKQMKARTASL